jgi:hypothetical protein
LIRDAAQRRLGRLYITLAIEEGRVSHSAELIRFIGDARSHGIAVEAVEGDPQMVTPAGLRSALARAAAIARFQSEAPPEGRLAEVQYDIEPYTLAEWGSHPVDHRGWADAVQALAAAAQQPVHLVLPFWVAEDEGGRQLLRELAPSLSGVTAMAYRSDPADIVAISEPLLSWGVAAGKPVRIALEAGPVAAELEHRLHLASAEHGRTTTQPARISFLGDEKRMAQTAQDLLAAFSAWSSFHGISYHGISWPVPAASATRAEKVSAPGGF